MFLRKEVRHTVGVLKESWGIIYTEVSSSSKRKGKPFQEQVKCV